jgi:hypothetical protein
LEPAIPFVKATPVAAFMAFLASFSVYAVPTVVGGHLIVPWGLFALLLFSGSELGIWRLLVLAYIVAAQALTWFVFRWFIRIARSPTRISLVLIFGLPGYFVWLYFALGILLQSVPRHFLEGPAPT